MPCGRGMRLARPYIARFFSLVMSPTTRTLTLRQARAEACDGDLLLFRGRGLFSSVIRWLGRSEYSHAAMAGWWGTDLMCLETRERKGGRAVTLESQVRRYPGCIDLFAGIGHKSSSKGSDVLRQMRQMTGADYGYWGIYYAALLHLPLVRRLLRPTVDLTSVEKRPPFCSQAVAWAYAMGDIDPVPQLAHRFTEPGDLARSLAFKYRGTLVPE